MSEGFVLTNGGTTGTRPKSLPRPRLSLAGGVVSQQEVLYRDEKHKHHSQSQDIRIGNRPALCTPVARMATSNAITTDPPAALAGIGN